MFEINIGVTIAAVFLSVALVAGSLTYVGLERSSVVRRRLRGIAEPGGRRDETGNPRALDFSPTDAPIVKRVTTFVPKSPKEMKRLQRRLDAGWELALLLLLLAARGVGIESSPCVGNVPRDPSGNETV